MNPHHTPATATVTLSVNEGVAQVALHRPTASNALDLQTSTLLAEITESLHSRDDLRAVVLTGAGRNFCVGGDITAMATSTDRSQFLADLAGAAHRAIFALTELSVPVVCAAQGAVAGAGIALTLTADVVIAEPDARFVLAYTGVGLTPDCGTSWMLPRAIGDRRALAMALSPDPISAQQAADWGLVTSVSEPGAALDDALDLAARWSASAPAALGGTRSLIRSSSTRTLREHLDVEAARISQAAGSDEAARLISAFVNRK